MLPWQLLKYSAAGYGLNQLRYDLRKMKAHGLIARDCNELKARIATTAGGF